MWFYVYKVNQKIYQVNLLTQQNIFHDSVIIKDLERKLSNKNI